MTPTQIISLIRDLFVVGALGFVIWWIHNAGANSVKVADMKALQKQLSANSALVEAWKSAADAAEVQREHEMASVSAAISAQRTPVLLCRSPHPSPVPSDPVTAGPAHPASGTAYAGPREGSIDIRPAINAFESRYENALSNCRQALASWPTSP